MMSSESLLALEPCGQSRLWDREPELGPALAKDSYITARGSPESGVSDRDPSGRPSPGPRSSAGVMVEMGRGLMVTIAPSSADLCFQSLPYARGGESGNTKPTTTAPPK
jgi:hypothetical protein